MAFDSGGVLALTFGCGLLVELAGAQLGEQSGFLDGTLEAAHRDFERLVLFNSYCRHTCGFPSELRKARIIAAANRLSKH